MPLQSNDVMDSQLPRHLGCTVAAAVVHHQVLDLVHPCDRARQVAHRLGECGFFVVAGNLDDQFHSRLACRTSLAQTISHEREAFG